MFRPRTISAPPPSTTSTCNSYGDAGVASERQGSLAGGCGTSNAQTKLFDVSSAGVYAHQPSPRGAPNRRERAVLIDAHGRSDRNARTTEETRVRLRHRSQP